MMNKMAKREKERNDDKLDGKERKKRELMMNQTAKREKERGNGKKKRPSKDVFFNLIG